MTQNISELATQAIDDLKGLDIKVLDVVGLSDVMDYMVIATGSSNRHVKSLAENVIEQGKKQSVFPIGVEGLEEGEWVLVDYGDTVIHVMQQKTRDFYELEKLWSMEPATRKNQSEGDK